MDRCCLQTLLRRAIAPALLALLVTASPAAAGLILPEAGGGSRQAEDTRTLYIIIFVIAVVVFVGVEGVLIYCMFKYRARKGRVAAQIHGNTRLEIGWTVGAAVILVFLTVATFVMLPGIKNPAASDIDMNGNPVAAQRRLRLDRPGGAAGWRRAEHRRRRDAVRVALRLPVDRRQEGLLVHRHVRAGRHDRDARHPLERRAALVVDPGAGRQDGRAARATRTRPGSRSPSRASGRASAPSCAGATTRTCTRA